MPDQTINTDTPPCDADQLHAWIKEHLGITVPRREIIPGHSAPFEYLLHSFFEGRGALNAPDDDQPSDCIVWANRGGGKTFLGAVATVLDLLFKPRIQIRILAGSLEQARRMHEHLREMFEQPRLKRFVKGKITDTRLCLTNGSRVELLAQSHASVRGTRVQKLRCDEVELFKPEIWQAAQLVTRSGTFGAFDVPGSIECLSTMHKPFGLMSRLVQEAAGGKRKVLKWGVVDVLARCGEARACSKDSGESCVLLDECQGQAKGSTEPGHIAVRDAIDQKGRVSGSTWESEMLCLKPDRSDSVYPEFKLDRHVIDRLPEQTRPGDMGILHIAGMDFGFRAPTVVLWATVDALGTIRVYKERVVAEVILAEHVQAICDAPGPMPDWIGVDPAGNTASEQTSKSAVDLLTDAGLKVRFRSSLISQGVELVCNRLAPAAGPARLFVHKRCEKLIQALERYHYNPNDLESGKPIKDGSDHAADALRYMVLNNDHKQRFEVLRY